MRAAPGHTVKTLFVVRLLAHWCPMNASADLSSIAPISSANSVKRVTVTTKLSFPQLVKAFEKELGKWKSSVGDALVSRRANWSEVKAEVAAMAGPHGLMIIYHADQGKIATLSGNTASCSLYLVGNPDIATRILRLDIRAGLLVPFRVQLYDDGKHGVISYDCPGSSLGTLQNPALSSVGVDLDNKITAVIAAIQAAGGA
jgi:uncharacterized protein (DUF302 family)